MENHVCRQSESPEQEVGSFRRFLRLLHDALLYFLEAIGLRRERADEYAQLCKLRLFHTEFRKLLSANNSFLESLGDLEKKSLEHEFVDSSFIIRKVVRSIADVHAMVESLNAISSDRYAALRERLDIIASSLTGITEETAAESDSNFVMDMGNVSSLHADLAGGKIANLGELRMKLGIPTPDGMVVTTRAYRELVESAGLRSWIQDRHLEFPGSEGAENLAVILREKMLALEILPELEQQILDGYDRLCSRMKAVCPVAVRSSAVGEDTFFSFAGQFQSLLNVSRDGLCEAYLQVLASLYSPEAIHYRSMQGISGESAEMAVGFLAMISAKASGVAFTKEPDVPDSGRILIQAVKGLGLPLVDGRVSPETFLVPRSGDAPGIIAPPPGAASPCLSAEEALQLARYAMLIENHFGSPQDIEWAIDGDRRIFILQSRPLRLPESCTHGGDPLPGVPLLLKGGERACPGIGAGPAVHMDSDDDLESFPSGAVLVARRSSPRFVRLMSRTSAIITDVGSTTGHLASLAREFRIPTILNIGTASRTISPGTVITVDAGNGFIYQGDVLELFPEDAVRKKKTRDHPDMRIDRGSHMLDRVLDFIAPLNLTEPGSPEFTPANCTTLHDLARFVHEKSYYEMFRLGENVGDLRGAGFHLDVFLPVDLYILDLGGGLKGDPKEREVKPSRVASLPFSALLKGMLHEKIPRYGPRAMDMKGLLSIMMRHAATNPEEEQSFREPCYAIISENYLNYTARVGYHFSVVDTYCSSIPNKNYVSLLFRGGAADYIRRNRRVRAIAEILRAYGFSVEVAHDRVSARLSKTPKEETISQLEMIGSLFQFFRQMDAAMVDEESVPLIRDAFLRGDYDLTDLSRA